MYQISVIKTVGGEVESLPIVTVGERNYAKQKVKETVEFYRKTLDHPTMRMVGANVEVVCEKVEHLMGEGAEIIMDCLIKRPIHSPSATVHWRKE